MTVGERWVYFIQAGESDGPIKIGSAGNPEAALAGHQISNAEALVLLGTCVGGYDREFALHRELAEWRIRGEWFRATAEVLAAVERCVAEDRDGGGGWFSREQMDLRCGMMPPPWSGP